MTARRDVQDGLAYSRELCQRVQDESDNATWHWFWPVALLVAAAAALASHVWPMGLAA